ncbi:MAG: S8 family peptidase [Cyclobacteriaceae bacterium]
MRYIRSVRLLFLLLLINNLGICQGVSQSKLSPHFQENNGKRITEEREFVLLLEDQSAFIERYKDLLLIIYPEYQSKVLNIKLANDQTLHNLIGDDNVQFIEIIRVPHEESLLNDPDLEFNRIRKWQADNPSFNSIASKVAIKEQMFKTDDIDLRNKYFDIGLAGESNSAHATSIATIISGRANSSMKSLGVLPGSMLTSSDFNNLIPDSEATLIANEIFVENHSYGVGIENYYGIEALLYDESIVNEPSLVHVFSAGNSGSQMPVNGTYEGLQFANLTGTFKQAKNVITVSGLDTALSINVSASRGPAYDGRLKPEFTAYGGRGTSDAAAIVTGVVSLLQYTYKSKWGLTPTASLIKSILIVSADDIGPAGIDYYSGYGNVNAHKATNPIAQNWMYETILESNDSENIIIDIPASLSQFKLAISWIDPPASIDAKSALVNDIDATLIFDDTSYLPWVLDHSANAASLSALPTRGQDHLNNVEYISLENPTAGSYTLQLKASELSGSQQVSVAWYFEGKEEFEWDFPNAKDKLLAGSERRLLWRSTFENASAKLEYRINDSDWETINANIDLGDNQKWKVPNQNGEAFLRMTIGDSSFVSDSFYIGQTPDIDVSFNCESTFGLSWSPVPNATGYEIYQMGTEYLEPIGNTNNTYFSLNKTNEVFYAVSAQYEDVQKFRGNALNYTFQGTFCYINFFAAERSESGVKLQLDLSTEIEIESINVFKFNDRSPSQSVASIVPDGNLSYTFIDNSADPGLIGYTAELNFIDGSKIISDTSNILVDDPGKVILFPNPATEDFINILSSGNGLLLEITDSKGALILEKRLDFRVEFIILKDFLEGLYYYRLFNEGKQLDSGKFVKY